MPNDNAIRENLLFLESRQRTPIPSIKEIQNTTELAENEEPSAVDEEWPDIIYADNLHTEEFSPKFIPAQQTSFSFQLAEA